MPNSIVKKYRPDLLEPAAPQEDNRVSGGQEQQMTEKNEPSPARQQDKEKRRSGSAVLQNAPRSRRNQQPVTVLEQDVKSDGQSFFFCKKCYRLFESVLLTHFI